MRATGACRRRVFTGTLDARLLALDADTGLPCADFGEGGQIDLTRGVRIRDPGAYLVTSPPTVYGNIVIVGSAIGDNRATNVERGIIRAFEAHTGALVWSFDPLPDSPSHPAAARVEPGPGRQHRGRQRLGRHIRRRRARPGLRPDRLCEPGLLRRRTPRIGPLRRHPARARRAQRPAGMAPAARPPRPVGLRPRRAAGARGHRGAGASRCRRSFRPPRPACCTYSSAPTGAPSSR